MTRIPPPFSDLDREDFAVVAREWLDANLARRTTSDVQPTYAIFHNYGHDEERALIDEARAWQATRMDAGFGAITWDTKWGGSGLSASHERVYTALEREYSTPDRHENVLVTVELVAPTILALGTDAQRDRFIVPFLRADELCCQLFSEPGAGSDLASLSTRAVRNGETWKVNGQKVWTSGAQFSDWGLLIARSDTTAPKHKGMTAFMVPMDAPGIETRPIRQMSGGSTFNEVFLSDVTIADEWRIGAEGEGWKVALTTLGFERNSSAGIVSAGGNSADLVRLATSLGIARDPLVRQRLAEAAIYERASALMVSRYAERVQSGAVPGVEGSVGKLVWTQNLKRVGDAAASFLGHAIISDTGVADTFAWTEHLLGAPGYRIAGGSDEIQRNIIGERGLGLPREPH
ncbi:acyl-CoA dehydrogenase [Dietzia sp. SLG310A2-38A2]|uniref:acyl-CoA dehydrogenase family protein n=1 Tax=Dietzia sp. SLG310A2-38A2 TaxID=1630643 RepID=UPI0015F7F914|nr:acyl-CoA dehydrogenase family protein [Dietzia sp. SLG310A2-38A2]MBB1029723.1 acyl-CoA dehydrogenase [Dietzia sp. SLG310A2-38A2]